VEIEVLTSKKIRIETYYCNFWNLAGECGLMRYSHILEKALPRLNRAFDILLQRNDFSNALSVARTYNFCNKGSSAGFLAESLASNDQIPALCRAQAQLLLAEKLKSPEQRDKQDGLYALALDSLKNEDHAYLALDTEIARMCRVPLDLNDDTFGERLMSLFKKYETLDYPTGFGSALLRFLNLAHELNDFDSQNLVLNDLESVFNTLTSKLTWLMMRTSTLARWSIRGGDRGKVISGATALWNDLHESDCSFYRGQAAQLISQAYSALGDREMMVEWSLRAQKDIPETNVTAIPSLTRGFDLSKIEHLQQYYEKTARLVDHENADYSPEDAAEKLEVFLSQALARPNPTPQSFDIIKRAIILYEGNIGRLTDPRLVKKQRANLQQSQGSLKMMMSSPRQDIEFELAALDAFKEARGLYVSEKLLGNAVIVLQHEGLVHVGIAQKFERVGYSETQQAWKNALSQYKLALDSANGLGLTFLSRESAYWVAFCEFRLWARGWYEYETVLNSLLLAESFVDQQRQEVSILRGMAAAVTKSRLSSHKHVRDIYRLAIQVCNRDGNVLTAWRWAQKSKARSLSDLLGLGVFIPIELMGKIQENDACRRLFEEEHKLVEDSTAAPDTERFKMRIQLEHLQKKMREQNVLAELLNLREGVPITWSEFSNITRKQRWNRSGRATVLIDWVVTNFGISMYVVKDKEEPILRQLAITKEQIQNWVSKHLNSGGDPDKRREDEVTLSGLKEEDEIEDGPLRDLDALVAPLAELSNPEDLLIFCPTGILHSLPLHALRIGSKEEDILIVRNPITYCASLTSFVQCCQRANSVTRTDVPPTKRLLAVYERESRGEQQDDESFSPEERQQVYRSINSLAENLNGESLRGEEVTYQTLKESLEESDLVHFHGHCDFDKEFIADQSLCISSAGEAVAGSSYTLFSKFL
jgi:CHAT domain-containing protein